MEVHPKYLSFLLRLWRADTLAAKEQEPVWRATLQHPVTRKRVGFACIDDLFDFLNRETGHLPNNTRDADCARCGLTEEPLTKTATEDRNG